MSGKRADTAPPRGGTLAVSAGPGGELEIGISAVVNPSEVEENVRGAILAVFPEAELETTASGLEGWRQVAGRARSLERFSEVIAGSRIRDAARAAMFRGMSRGDESSTRFFINKQAALSGKVNFVDEAVILGPIVVELRGARLVARIDEMTLHD